MTEESLQVLIARIDVNVNNLILRFDKMEKAVDKLEEKKADVKVVDEVRDELHDFLNGVKEIIAVETRPWTEVTKKNAEEIEKIWPIINKLKNYFWKATVIVSTVILALQFFYNIYQEKIQSIFGL